MSRNPFRKKKPSEQIQEYLDSKTSGATPGGVIPSGVIPGGGNANAPMARPSTPNQYVVGQVQNPTESVSSGVSGGLSGALKSPKPPEDTKPPEYVLTLPEQPPQQAGAGNQPQGPTYTLTLPTPEEQALALEQARKQAHMAAFADQMAAMDAEFWRIAQNPGSMLGANESPYYSLYMKQYQQRARDRETNAYTRATAGTGGYGSSFATMAGDQAYRETMHEFDELAPTLIKSKSERMAEILQEREMLKAMEDQLNAGSTEDGTLTETASAAAQELQNTWGTDYSEKTQREYLASKGYSEADINAALESQRKLASGTFTDYKAGTITDAVKQAQSLDDAYRQGTLTVEEYDAAKAQNSKVIMDNVNKGMVRIDDVDHAALGISDEEWSSMKDGEKKLAVFDSVGQLVKSGAVRESDYYKLLYNDIQEELASEDYQKSKNKTRDVVDIAIVIQDLYDNGYMSEDSYKDIVYNELMPNIEDDKTFKTIVYYARDYDNYGSDTKMAINLMDEQRIIPNIGKYNTEEQQMLLTIARGYNGDKIKRKK